MPDLSQTRLKKNSLMTQTCAKGISGSEWFTREPLGQDQSESCTNNSKSILGTGHTSSMFIL